MLPPNPETQAPSQWTFSPTQCPLLPPVPPRRVQKVLGQLARSWSGTHAHRADGGGHSTLGIPGEAAPYGPTLTMLRSSPSQMLLSDSEPPEFGLMLTAAGHNSLLRAQGSSAPGSLALATDMLPVRAGRAWAWMYIHT